MDLYLILVYLLFALAIVDLIVGVSNDAVNFLNSAIGSKVATVRTIMIVASVGILIGTTFSSGMMEVARKGIFNPSFFTFDKMMFIFISVMLTDIILLDLYNSWGFPTSTTVSIVFELLGSGFMIGILSSLDRGVDPTAFNDFLNTSKAVEIIGGIFASVFVAFTAGSLGQYFARVTFTFRLEETMRKYGAVFSGIAITFITYFLVVKGAKGSSFISDGNVKWITENSMLINLVSFVFWSIISQILMVTTKFNPLKLVVLMGTFSLAMAFAGNDLVNFIGVAIAGMQAFAAWKSSGVAEDQFFMDSLAEKVQTPTMLLLIAGVIMVITLWLSSKAKKVTETEVSLGRQDEGDERFGSNMISRVVVGSAMAVGRGFGIFTSRRMKKHLNNRFDKKGLVELEGEDAPAFDLVRASVNLMVSSILISYATSLKMPLSTTYVSFMVAMGSSLADRAWGRDSAVYRVAGVLNVIGGWLLTAVIAFVASALFGFVLYKTEFYGALAIAALAAFLLIRSHISFKRKTAEENAVKSRFVQVNQDIEEVIKESKLHTAEDIENLRQVYSMSIRAVIGQNRDVLMRSDKEMDKLIRQHDKLQGKIIKFVRKMGEDKLEAGRLYLLVFDLMQDMAQSASYMSKVCRNHVINHHPMPHRDFIDTLMELDTKMSAYLKHIQNAISSLEFPVENKMEQETKKFLEYVDEKIDSQVISIQKDEVGSRLGHLQTKVLLESRDMIETASLVYKVYHNYAFRKAKTNAVLMK